MTIIQQITQLKLRQNLRKIKIIKTKRISNYPAINQIDVINNAFFHSKGKFIFFVRFDDFFEKGKLKK